MKISTKGRYAIRMMLDLATHESEVCVALKDIAERQDISKKYLEQIVPLLNKAELLKTNRGYKGGYMLARSPSQYTVGDILRVTEGSLVPVNCAEQTSADCPRSDECPTLFLWQGLYKVISEYLDSITLQDLLDRTAEGYSNNYVI